MAQDGSPAPYSLWTVRLGNTQVDLLIERGGVSKYPFRHTAWGVGDDDPFGLLAQLPKG